MKRLRHLNVYKDIKVEDLYKGQFICNRLDVEVASTSNKECRATHIGNAVFYVFETGETFKWYTADKLPVMKNSKKLIFRKFLFDKSLLQCLFL